MPEDKDEKYSQIPELHIPDNTDIIPPNLFENASKEMEWVIRCLIELRHDTKFLKQNAIDTNTQLRKINGSVRKLKEFENDMRSNYIPQLAGITQSLNNTDIFYDHYVKAMGRYNTEKTKVWVNRTALINNSMKIAWAVGGAIAAILAGKFLF